MLIIILFMKVNRIKVYGVEVIFYGDVYDEVCNYVLELVVEKGYIFIYLFDDFDVVIG